MASFSAGTTFTDGVANDVTAAKLAALVNNATPTSGLIQDRTAETIIATNDAFLFGDASDSNNLKRITVANFTQTLPTAKVTTGTIETGTFGTTTSTAATITTGTIPTLVSTTLITSGTGTASAPAIVPTGDTNTGVLFPAADTVAISTQGTERARIDSSGNFLIGATSADSTLTLASRGYAQLNGASDSVIAFTTGGTLNGYIYNATNEFRFATYAANAVTLVTNNSEKARITSDGNFGIGIQTPNQKLVVVGATSDTETIRVITGSAAGTKQTTGIGFAFSTTATNPSALIQAEEFDISDAKANIVFSTNNTGTDVAPTERMRISSAGNVSIGTATALSTLHVHGNLTLSNTTTATSAGTGGLSKPATYAGYLTVSINGTSRKIPYYAT